ncbi:MULTISPECIES: GlxA family transcriptional regulator [unclassified Marinovum]
MRKWTRAPLETQNVAVLLFPRFSNLCLANAVEPMRAANELLMREAYRWSFVTLDGAPVESSSGLPVLPNCPLRDHPGGAFLFVLSSYDVRAHATPAVNTALSAAAKRFDCVVGMDTGAWLMAQAGLLDGAQATIHWAEITAFSERFDTVDALSDRVVISGNRVTSGGAMAAFDTVLEMIRRDHGAALHLEVSAFFLHRSAEPPSHNPWQPRGSPLVERGIALMSANIETPLSIGQLATHLQTTQRSLTRAFQAEFGAAPKAVYKWLRLAAARRYAQQSDYSITEIALRCGYGNAAAMTRAFVAQYGRPPRSFRA